MTRDGAETKTPKPNGNRAAASIWAIYVHTRVDAGGSDSPAYNVSSIYFFSYRICVLRFASKRTFFLRTNSAKNDDGTVLVIANGLLTRLRETVRQTDFPGVGRNQDDGFETTIPNDT